MPPRQVEKPSVKAPKQANNRVDSVVMPPRSGGKIPTTRTPQLNSVANKFAGSGGKQHYNNVPTSPYDVRNTGRPNLPYMPPALPQSSYGQQYNLPRQNAHTGGPIRHERPPIARGTPYNIPPPHQYGIVPTLHSYPQPQQLRSGPISNTIVRSHSTNSNVRSVQSPAEIPLKISFQNDSISYNKHSEPSSDIQERLEQLERTQKLLLKELEANKRGLQNKDEEIASLTSTIEDQKRKLNKREESRPSNNNNSQNDSDNYKFTNSNRNNYDEDDDYEPSSQSIATGSINAHFAKARNASGRV